MNLYAYVGNDPVNLIDPTGMSCEPNRNGSYDPGCEIVVPGYCDAVCQFNRQMYEAEQARNRWGSNESVQLAMWEDEGTLFDFLIEQGLRAIDHATRCGVFTFGGNAAAAQGFGPAAGGGAYWDRATGTVGPYSQLGLATGEGALIGAEAGYYKSLDDFGGPAATGQHPRTLPTQGSLRGAAGFGPSANVSINPLTLEITGGGGGVDFGGGALATSTNTTTHRNRAVRVTTPNDCRSR